jgi:hypothetical protein
MRKLKLIKTGPDAGHFQYGHQVGTKDLPAMLKDFDSAKRGVSLADKRVYSQLPKQASGRFNMSMRQAYAAARAA